MTPTIYFARHGQTAWNAEGRLQGQAETDITDRGRAQARRNGRLLAGLIAEPSSWDFVASPMRRTRETMELIRGEMGLPAQGYRTEPRLIEVSFGDWQGHTFAELDALTPGASRARKADKWNFLPPGPGAESYRMLCERVAPWLAGVRRDTVCVTHGGVMRAVFRIVERLPPQDAAALEIFQDRVLRLEQGRLDWL